MELQVAREAYDWSSALCIHTQKCQKNRYGTKKKKRRKLTHAKKRMVSTATQTFCCVTKPCELVRFG